MAELQQTTVNLTLASCIRRNTLSASSHLPALPHARMRELYVTSLGSSSAACTASRSPHACCQRPLPAKALSAGLYDRTLGSSSSFCMAISKDNDKSHCSVLQVPIAKL